jgi:hypothetical protein
MGKVVFRRIHVLLLLVEPTGSVSFCLPSLSMPLLKHMKMSGDVVSMRIVLRGQSAPLMLTSRPLQVRDVRHVHQTLLLFLRVVVAVNVHHLFDMLILVLLQ